MTEKLMENPQILHLLKIRSIAYYIAYASLSHTHMHIHWIDANKVTYFWLYCMYL